MLRTKLPLSRAKHIETADGNVNIMDDIVIIDLVVARIHTTV